jgi:hypothetical protein
VVENVRDETQAFDFLGIGLDELCMSEGNGRLILQGERTILRSDGGAALGDGRKTHLGMGLDGIKFVAFECAMEIPGVVVLGGERQGNP